MAETKRELTVKYSKNESDRIMLASLLDKLEACEKRNVPASTHFLSPGEIAVCESLLKHLKAEYTVFGGYEDYERGVICFLPEYIDEEWLYSGDSPVCAIRVSCKTADALTHRDYLGALMGIGIERSSAGDMIVSETGCDFLLLREIKDYVLQNFISAGKYPVSLSEIPLSELYIPKQEYKEINTTLMSLRLDAAVSSGFGLSREKAADLIKAGKVSLNHGECLKPDKPISEGDVISARGFGKMTVDEIGGNSRKGRTIVRLKRFI